MLMQVFILVFAFILGATTRYPGHYRWTPPEHNRTSLFCPTMCQDPILRHGQPEVECCACRSKPEWELESNEMSYLYVEYFSRRGYANIIDLHGVNKQYKLLHVRGVLSRIPDNICDFPGIIILNLEGNLITDIGNISCLVMLYTLILKNNMLTELRNTTFHRLAELRVLDLSHNNIETIEPYSLSHPSIGMLEMDISDNSMRELEFSNFLLLKSFCRLDLSNNHISRLVNEGGFRLDVNSDKFTDGGMVDLSQNEFETFFDFRAIGVDDITEIGRYKDWGFDVTGAKWSCDCKMVEFLQRVDDFLKHIWRDYFNVTCYEPAHLQNQSIPQLVLSHKLDLFICNLSQSDGCPKHCKCVEQTNQNRLLVNCESTGQKSMPNVSTLPDWYDVELNLARNKIKTVKSLEYLNRTTVLNISGNMLIDIVPDVFKALENKAKVIDISDNEDLNFEDLHFRNIDRCVLNIDSVVMKCDCNHQWIEGWLQQEPIQRDAPTCENSTFYCDTESGLVVASEFSWDCKKEESDTVLILSSIFGSFVAVMLISVFFLEKFKLELYLFYRNKLRRAQSIT